MSTKTDKLLSFIPDRLYIQIKYFYHFHKFANLKNPRTYNEKLQWLKLNDHNSIYHKLADKYEVKEYVKNIIGEEYVIKTLGLWDNFDDIDFNSLPNKFVLKCTHDSGGLVVCKDKSKLVIEKAKKTINESLNTNYYYHSREWAYKDIKPRIIAEEYIETENGDLPDYKLFCFDGEVKALYVATDRFSKDEETKFDFFDENFEHLPFVNSHPNSNKTIEKPINFNKMKELASMLTKEYTHIRADFYNINGKIYFGELTFYHMSGFQPFYPKEWDYKFGSWLEIPNK